MERRFLTIEVSNLQANTKQNLEVGHGYQTNAGWQQSQTFSKQGSGVPGEYGVMESPPSINISSKYFAWRGERHNMHEISEAALPRASIKIFILPFALIKHSCIMLMGTRDMIPFLWTTSRRDEGLARVRGPYSPPLHTGITALPGVKKKNTSIHSHIQNALAEFLWGTSGALQPGKSSVVLLVSPQCPSGTLTPWCLLQVLLWQAFRKTGQPPSERRLEPRPHKASGVIYHAGIAIAYFPAQPFCMACIAYIIGVCLKVPCAA